MLYKCLEKVVKLEMDDEQFGEKSMELEYYLVESEETEDEDLLGEKVYGIEIVKKSPPNQLEKKLVKNISCSRENTREIVSKLAYHSVMPSELIFILDDMLGT